MRLQRTSRVDATRAEQDKKEVANVAFEDSENKKEGHLIYDCKELQHSKTDSVLGMMES